MQVQLVFIPEAANYQELLEDLREELHALEGPQGLKYDEVTAKAPANVLSVEHDVVKFVFEHSGTLLTLVTTLLQLLRSASERRNIPEKKDDPPAVLVVGANTLKIPASPGAEKRFLNRIKQGKSPKPAAKKKGAAARVRSKKNTRKQRPK
jgi:hypothetical protein